MYNLKKFKYHRNEGGTVENDSHGIPDIIPETPTKYENFTENSQEQEPKLNTVRKKRRFDFSSDEEGSEEVVRKYKKTGITHFVKKPPEKKGFSNFISPDSGTDSENDQDSDDDTNNRVESLKGMFPKYSEDTLRGVCRSTCTLSGAIAILSRWKCEDIKNLHNPSPEKDSGSQNSRNSFDSPLVPARRKNCLRWDSEEKERRPIDRNGDKRSSKRIDISSSESENSSPEKDLGSQNSRSSFDSPLVPAKRKNCLHWDSEEKERRPIDRNGDKRSSKRLDISSSESESDGETNSSQQKPIGPFPRLSCIVTNSTGSERDDEEKTDVSDQKEVKARNGISKFYSKKNISWKYRKDKKASKFENDTLTMDNAADENFSAEDDFDSASSDDEFSDYGKKRKTGIVQFFQNAEMDELITMHSCSQKKADIIMGLRPFKSWNDLVKKFGEAKFINTQMIFHCADLIKERAVLERLLTECRNISSNLATEIEKLHCHDHMTEGSALIKAPKLIPYNLKLKPYQLVGLNWIVLLHRNKVNGILADEMGLGKTVQTISFLAHLLEQDPQTGPHLIVVPSSTLDNWCREFSLWCPDMDVAVYRGTQSERRAIRVEFLRGRTTNVVVTTYNSAISTPEDRLFFRKLGVQYAVFDEGHMLKNMSSQRYVNLMKIKAASKLLLTGTPLQNNLLELMSLLRFVMPHMFEQTTDTLVRIFSMSRSESKSKFAKDRIKDAKDIMQPFVLRRLKDEVLKQLPAKDNEIVYCKMAGSQKTLYEETRQRFRLKLNKQLPLEMKNVFIELRKVANHPLLRRHHYTTDMLVSMAKLLKKDPEYHDSREHLMVEDMTVMTDFELHCFCQTTNAIRKYALDESEILNTGKFKMLDKLLTQFEQERSRVLIFSQFTMIMDIVEKYLKIRKHKFLRLDGSTPVNTRLNLIDQFNSDSSILVFLLSTKAGGLGINLTAANVVILHDIDLNPYNDKQAEDRCHRLGQTRSVKVFRLISTDTLEEGMLQLAENKLKLEKDMTANEDETSDIASLLKKTLVL